MTRPEDRGGFAYRVYCALVCEMKITRSKKTSFRNVATRYGWKSPFYARHIYDRFIRPQLSAGVRIEDLA